MLFPQLIQNKLYQHERDQRDYYPIRATERFGASSIGYSLGAIRGQLSGGGSYASAFSRQGQGQQDEPLSEAALGTTLHRFYEGLFLKQGTAQSVEDFSYYYEGGIVGTSDYQTKAGILGDVKSLNAGSMENLFRYGPSKSGIAQTNYYAGRMGYPNTQLMYTLQDNPAVRIGINTKFDPELYKKSVEKVQRAREQVETEQDLYGVKKYSPGRMSVKQLTETSREETYTAQANLEDQAYLYFHQFQNQISF